MAHPFAVFAKGWDSVLPGAAAGARSPDPISCPNPEDQNLKRFVFETPALAKKRKGGPTRGNLAFEGDRWSDLFHEIKARISDDICGQRTLALCDGCAE